MPPSQDISVPGRVNLIGEHIDYHDLPVLPMAIGRHLSFAFKPRPDNLVCVSSPGYPERHFAIDDAAPFPAGDWGNYLKAAVQMLAGRWPLRCGLDLSITTNLSAAAGLSSSSALLTGVALALLKVNEISLTVFELMKVLPDGEQYVGTRGGGMDHAAVLAGQPGCALLLHFAPFRFEPIAIPSDWAFVAAHSLTLAEKSGALKSEYNLRRTAGRAALEKLRFASYSTALEAGVQPSDSNGLPEAERRAFRHVVSEARRVAVAVDALRCDNIGAFGEVLVASHASLRDQLQVTNPSIDALVEQALRAGAIGARLTGAGFGGCVLLLCRVKNRAEICERLISTFYAGRPDFRTAEHLLPIEPSAGALYA